MKLVNVNDDQMQEFVRTDNDRIMINIGVNVTN